eukprot:563616-Hanusia_phi.AAC.2
MFRGIRGSEFFFGRSRGSGWLIRRKSGVGWGGLSVTTPSASVDGEGGDSEVAGLYPKLFRPTPPPIASSSWGV